MIDPLIAVRAIHFLATVLVAGTVFFAHFVAEPVWRRSATAPIETISRPTQIAWLQWAALVVAVVSGGAWLVLLAANIADQPVGNTLSDGTVWVVLTETQFGFVWQLRLALAALLATNWLLAKFAAEQSSFHGFLGTVVGAAFVGALAWSGHGGSTLGREGDVHVAADVLHLIAATAWLGGLVPLVLVLRLSGLSAMFAESITNRFSILGIVSVGTLAISGVMNAWFLVGDPQNLIATSYGRLLLVKIAIFVAMVCVAAVNRFHLMPELTGDLPAGPSPSVARAIGTIRRNALIEIVLGLAILVVVSGLGTMTPAAHEPADHVHEHVH